MTEILQRGTCSECGERRTIYAARANREIRLAVLGLVWRIRLGAKQFCEQHRRLVTTP